MTGDFDSRVAPFRAELHAWLLSNARRARPFTRGEWLPPTNKPFYAVNVMCLDSATDQELSSAPIHFADGRNDHWQQDALDSHHL